MGEPLFSKFLKSEKWKEFKDILDKTYEGMDLDFIEYIDEEWVRADNILFVGNKNDVASILNIRNYIYLCEDNFDKYYRQCRRNGTEETNEKYKEYVNEFLSYFDFKIEDTQDKINKLFLKNFEEDVKEQIGDKYINTRNLVLDFSEEFIRCHKAMKLIIVMDSEKNIVKIYDSLTECEKNIKNDLGISISHSKVSKAISSHKLYKGYFFVQYQISGDKAKKRKLKRCYAIIDNITGNVIVILTTQAEVKDYLAEKLKRNFSIAQIRELTRTGKSRLGIRIEKISKDMDSDYNK